MEKLTVTTEDAPTIIPSERQLPSGANKVERITQHTKGLVEDLTSWVELKMKLTQVEIEERIDEKANKALVSAIAGVFFALTGLFALITLALGLGAWLGHPAWGFLIVTVLLGLLSAAVIAVKPKLLELRAKEKVGDEPARIEAA